MSTAGLSRSRLERMHQVLSGHVERKEMPGLVALVSHHDDVHVETLGTDEWLQKLGSLNQLTPEQRAGSEILFGTHSSWGFGMAVDIRRDQVFHTRGRFGWDGGFGTTAYTEPAEGMIGILFTQRMMDSPEPPKVFTDFWTLAYGAMK